MSKLSFKQILLFGVLIEILIFLIFYLLKDNIGDIFRYSARYPGRVSLIIYLYCFHLFYQSVLVKGSLKRLKELVYIFGVLHLIHFCFVNRRDFNHFLQALSFVFHLIFHYWIQFDR